VAGKRAGLAGERSGLFMEQLRIIKEMREADAGRGRSGKELRPRFMVWENVPGAFSSNKGADFGAVLQETIRVVCEAPAVPMPNKGWPLAGCLYGEGGDWSLAWRVFDAQFWGVPQRRRRIALVADFGGLTAPEILFERESVSGYYPQGRTPWETATAHPPSGTRDTSTSPPLMCAGFKSRAGAEADIAFRIEQSPTLLAGNDDASVILAPPLSVSENQQAEFRLSERCNALSTGGGQTRTGIPLLASVYDARGNGDGEVVPTMTGDHNGHVSDYTAVCVAQLAYDQFSESGIASTLKSSGGSYGGGQ